MTAFYKSCGNYAVSNMGSEAVLVPLVSGIAQMKDMVNLNETAAFILHLLEDGSSVDDIVDAVMTDFDATDVSQVRQDVIDFIDKLVARGFFAPLPDNTPRL